MWNDELILIKNNYSYNKAGDKVPETIETPILCDVRSATRAEFYDYADNENRPEYIASINTCEFDNQKVALFRGNKYRITRTYKVDRDLMELTLSKKISR